MKGTIRHCYYLIIVTWLGCTVAHALRNAASDGCPATVFVGGPMSWGARQSVLASIHSAERNVPELETNRVPDKLAKALSPPD